MNPHDEIRALTCHCGRISCRHHEETGTHITFLDRNGGEPVHKAQAVLIDGREVLVEADSIDIECGYGVATSVTLKILPQTITFE